MMVMFLAPSMQHCFFALSSRKRNFVAKISRNFAKFCLFRNTKFREVSRNKHKKFRKIQKEFFREISSTTLLLQYIYDVTKNPTSDFLRIWTSVTEPHHFYAAPAPTRIKILMRLRLRFPLRRLWLRLRHLPYCIARQNFFNELKFKHMLKLSCSYDSVRFVLLKI
jgi:hypothetical protein